MRCTACGAELILSNVTPDAVPGCEHHTFICSQCHVTERRVVFTRHGARMTARPVAQRRRPHPQRAWSIRTPLLQACLAACLRDYAGTKLVWV